MERLLSLGSMPEYFNTVSEGRWRIVLTDTDCMELLINIYMLFKRKIILVFPGLLFQHLNEG